jgi:pSer/pThr/pTyr-binding forkhead associated (FHA) protein
MAGVLITTPNGSRTEHRLGSVNLLGRCEKQNIQIVDPQVSRQHAALTWFDGAFWLQDRASRNGTYLNGERVFGPLRLSDGDRIEMGDTHLLFSDRFKNAIKGRLMRLQGDAGGPADRVSLWQMPPSDTDSVNEW